MFCLCVTPQGDSTSLLGNAKKRTPVRRSGVRFLAVLATLTQVRGCGGRRALKVDKVVPKGRWIPAYAGMTE